MAIYHFSAQVISRSAGRSAVAAAAYRSGERLHDERYGMIHDYSRKVVAEQEIIAPQHAPEWVYDRERLWNAVEAAEKRKDSQLCREINVALPKELTEKEQRFLVMNFAQKEFVDKGMIADIAIHRNDADNPHAHIMLTMREITPDGFGSKNRDWNKKEWLESWREQWERHANRALERAGREERIDHRSFERQGITDRLPTIHEGPKVRQMEKRGIATDRGEINREVREYNAQVISLERYREVQNKWRYFSPDERKAVLRAADTIQQSIFSVPPSNEGRRGLEHVIHLSDTDV
ncbi:MobQ family relaxase [Brevibacillus massiliensis]|uniref:MobQ family relaxase n=1 Tax=Brevibacillus massiliensis TaxID=1118054 RepID=UPI00030FAACE|nr:MobQ family relaxase [Brevibacillus massiliensis]